MIVKWRSALCASVALSLAGAWSPAFAQNESDPPPPASRPALGSLESVTVTGTKRDELAQDVPIALSAISANQIENTFRTDILAVSDLSPSVQLGQVAGFRAVAGGIRGTGQNGILVTTDQSVVLLVDEFALTNVQSQFVEMFDVERVEVYRGPQGTLFGKSATGGAISIITKRPVLNEFHAEVEAHIGKFDSPGGGMIGKGRLALNIPVVDDKLAFRFTALYDYDDGYFTNDKPASDFPDNVPYYYIPTQDTDGDGVGDTPICALSFGCSNPPPFPDGLNTSAQGGGERLNGTDVFAARFKALLTPTDNYEAYFIFDFLRDRSEAVPGINESPAGMLLPLLGFSGIHTTGQENVYSTGTTNQCPGGSAFCQTKGHRVNVEGYNLQQTLDLDDVTFKLITAYRHMTEILPDTYTGEAFTALYDASRNTTRKSFQGELRATTNFDGPFNFVAGLSYSYDKTDMLSYGTVGLTSLITFLPGGYLNDDGDLNLDLDYINDPTNTGARQHRNTYAAYLDMNYDITDDLRITLGGRYTYDKKTFFRRQNPGGPCTVETPAKDQVQVNGVCLDRRSNALSRVPGDFSVVDADPFEIALPDSAFGIAETFNSNWDKLTWRAVLDYKVNADTMVYASYSTGFIPGGFTETCSSLVTCQPYESETNWNAEVGLKGQFFDRTLQTNLSFFWTRYSNLVRSQVLPFTNAFGVTTQETVNVNAGTSRNLGVELEATWVPVSNLRFDFNLGYMDHDYIEFTLNGQDLSNLIVPYSPKWKFGGSITYDIALGNGGMLTLNTSANYTSTSQSSVFNPIYTEMSSRTLWDASVTWRDADDRYRVTGYVKNILDERYRTGANSVAGLWNFTMWGRPREYGVQLGVYF